MANSEPYNPLDKVNLGKSVAEALLDQDVENMDLLEVFDGAGVYAIYYRGPFAPYAQIAKANDEYATLPIYIGRASPASGRRGLETSAARQGRALYNRLRNHADTISAAVNLELGDFQVRWLAVDDIWIPLGESLLLSKFQPVWNSFLDGFGNHDPGAGRHAGLIPLWDVLHPGRRWASSLRPRDATAEQLGRQVAAYIAEHMPKGDAGKIDFGQSEP